MKFNYTLRNLLFFLSMLLIFAFNSILTFRYEGTGRSLSLKLLQELRKQSAGGNDASKTPSKRTLYEVKNYFC